MGPVSGDLPRVGVVVPYYRAQEGLDRLLAGLEQQTYPAGLLDVVVADDGSPQPPVLGERPFAVRTVRQEDLGFRAAAARNLGARATDAPVVLFLDGDMVPSPGYVAAMAAALHPPGEHPRLVVGRRRHATLSGHPPEQVARWLHDPVVVPSVRELAEPSWLTQGYAETDDLRAPDSRSYRFVISACLGVDRALLTRTGGFDETFVGYGGEDWDLGYRAWLAGADLQHLPEAVAWHDGPDIVGRDEAAVARKDAESLRVAAVITEPGSRDPRLLWPYADTVVRVDLPSGTTAGQVVLTVGEVLRGTDARCWLVGAAAAALSEGGGAGPLPDPRVASGEPPAAHRARARNLVDVTAPVLLDRDTTLSALCALGPARYAAGLTVRHTRDLARGQDQVPPAERDAQALVTRQRPATLEAAWGWGGHRPSGP